SMSLALVIMFNLTFYFFFFFQAEDGIRDRNVTGVQTCALPIYGVLLSGTGYDYLKNYIESPEQYNGKTITVSALVKNPGGQFRRSEERRVGKERNSRW